MAKLLSEKKLLRYLTLVFSAIFFIALIFFLLRGPYLSNSIKRLILPVLEKATGERILIDKAAVNLFPFYLQAKEFKVFDKDGDRLLRITKIRAYIDFSGLFFKEIRIRRLTIREPELAVEKKELESVINSIKQYLENKKDEDISVSLKSAKITDGKFTLSDAETQTTVSGRELRSELAVKNSITAMLSLKYAGLKLPNLPEVKGSLEGTLKTDGSKFEFSGVKFISSGSVINAAGKINPFAKDNSTRGIFSGDANILISTIRKIFNLQKERDGELSLNGTLDLIAPQQTERSQQPALNKGNLNIKLNLKTKGWFYLETLMELLKIDENISGLISLNGKIQGVYPDLSGDADLTFKNGMLATLPIDSAAGIIKYKNKRFSLEDFTAHTYEGELKGNAYLYIPSGNYSVTADVTNINSPEFLKFIQWEPPFPRGKISGNFELIKEYNEDFDIRAAVSYINTTTEGTELKDRLNRIKGNIELGKGILRINHSQFSTALSDLFLNGDIDLNNNKLNLDLELKSRDAADLTSPHYNGLRAPVRFRGKATGSTMDPEIPGHIEIGTGSVNCVSFNSISGDLTYSIKTLLVKSLTIEEGKSTYDISGNIRFKKATKLFSFDSPYYDAAAVIKNGDAGSLLTAASSLTAECRQIPITGSINGELTFKGDARDFSGKGELNLNNGVVSGQTVDHAVIRAVLTPQKIDFLSVEVISGHSRVNAKGALYFDGRIDASAASENIELRDITSLANSSNYLAANINGKVSADIKGSGTIKNPEVKFFLNILESSFRGSKIGRGAVNGKLKDNRFFVKAELLEGIVTADAAGIFSKPVEWDMTVIFKKGNYDFLLSGLLKEVPSRSAVTVSLEGITKFAGQGSKVSMDSKFSFMDFSLYGYNLKNKKDVVLKLSENEFMIKSLSLAGKDADISASGTVKIGQNYNIGVDGRINLEPLRTASKAIESLQGEGNLAIGISGPWDTPEFRGKINIKDSAVILAGFPYKIGPVNGDVFFNKDRITFESFNADFASGKVAISGIGYLKGLTLRGLSISLAYNDIKLRHIEGVSAAFDGRLFYDYSAKGQSLTGDIFIKKAKYEKRTEWKSGLLTLKEVKTKQPPQIRVAPALLAKTKLNVHIAGQDNISIDNNLARTPVKIDITVTGTVSQYGLIGKVEASGGSIFFRGNEFKIINGNTDFVETNRVTPVFHIQAETFTKGYRVRLNLDGPVDKFTLSLFSDPPLTDTDILTLLTVGQISKEAKGFESGIGAGEATAFLTGGLQEVMEERFKYITGFERFEVDPHTTSTGAVSPKVTVSKRLFKEKVFVTYSTSIGTTEENIIKLEYNLGRNVSLVGSRDEIGSLGADIKFRFEFK
ncbi:MAG: translocation/assembly module TamB domain-containing protein [Nitrospirae bacterium]|nr:translocation/assembly module TamB domain-containing protein [Nitrospirota bacterium]